MLVLEAFVKEGDMSYNAKPVEEQSCFLGIAEMPVDILVLDVRVSGGGFRQEGVHSFVRVIIRIFLSEFLGLVEFGVQKFRVVFLDVRFDSRWVVYEVVSLLRVKFTADRLGNVNEVKEH
jgi:hypothetical protein